MRLTREKLENNAELRRNIIDTPIEQHYLLNTSAMEFKKEYESPLQQKADNQATWENSSLRAVTDKQQEIIGHNVKLLNEYKAGEEGIDFIPGMKDARVANINKVKRDVKAEINQMKISDPLLAQQYEQILFKKDEFDEPPTIDPTTIVKYYPGSPKGPKPEDDPKHYSEWFMRNQPKEAIYGKGINPDFRDIGARWKYVFSKNEIDEDAMHVEYKDNVQNFMEQDQAYPMQGYKGQPEFDISDREKYDTTK